MSEKANDLISIINRIIKNDNTIVLIQNDSEIKIKYKKYILKINTNFGSDQNEFIIEYNNIKNVYKINKDYSLIRTKCNIFNFDDKVIEVLYNIIINIYNDINNN